MNFDDVAIYVGDIAESQAQSTIYMVPRLLTWQIPLE
jgi:hypothetical protein